MFTGIVEEIGTVTDVSSIGGGIRLRIYAPASAQELKVNDSVAINGVCQTVVSKNIEEFDVEAVEETLKKTTFASLAVGDHVNLELPLRFHERLGGHLILGHVDTVGNISHIQERSSSWMISIEVPENYKKYLIPVGSLAIDGISLTIVQVENHSVNVSIIPHTMENTICKFYVIGDHVNVEFDMIGKYVEQLMSDRNDKHVKRNFFTEKELHELGY